VRSTSRTSRCTTPPFPGEPNRSLAPKTRLDWAEQDGNCTGLMDAHCVRFQACLISIFLSDRGRTAAGVSLGRSFRPASASVYPQSQAVPAAQQKSLTYVGAMEEAMVAGFPFEVPAEYANLPQLKVGVGPPTMAQIGSK
jgi:hypothetical protein